MDDEEDRESCGCVWVINHGMRFLVERCEEHESLYQQEEARKKAKRDAEAATEKEDEDDEIPF